MSERVAKHGHAGKGGWRRQVRRGGAALRLLLLMAIWFGFTLYSFDATPSNDCSLKAEAHDSLFERGALWLMTATARDHGVSPYVEVVTITPGTEPASVQDNTCAGRHFFAALIPALDRLGPRVIAIDKVYGARSCEDESANAALRAAVQQAHAQIIVGQPTTVAEGSDNPDNCLVLVPTFDFGQATGARRGMAMVQSGLTRLNNDLRRIPLTWPVRPASGEGAARPQKGFAFTAAEAFDPGVEQRPEMARMLQPGRQPYSRLARVPQETGAMQILCAGVDPAQVAQWGGCEGVSPASVSLRGKAVVVGQRSRDDLLDTWQGERYGLELQASYLDALLRGLYVKTVPFSADFLLVAAFVIAYGVLALRLQGDEWRALWWDVVAFGVFVAVLVLLLLAGYFAPYAVMLCTSLCLLIVGNFLWLSVAAARGRPRDEGETA